MEVWITMNVYDTIDSILNLIQDKISKKVPEFKDVSQKIRLEDRDTSFPNCTIIPVEEIFEAATIGTDYQDCIFSVQIVIQVKKLKEAQGFQDLLRITGKVVDALFELRRESRNEIFYSLDIDKVDNDHYLGDNYALYSSSIDVRILIMLE